VSLVKRHFLAPVFAAVLLATPLASVAAEFQVATNGNDTNAGTKAAPLRTIQHAADLAQPGDVIIVHGGVYRERVNPPRGGESDKKRIVYQAAPGEQVAIKGSEIITNWVKLQYDVWKVVISNSFFGGFNPYGDLIHGDWFQPIDRLLHTGAVYLNGEWLTEAASLDDVLKPVGDAPLWFCHAGQDTTTIWAQFKGVNPNRQLVEINARRTVFYPEKPGRNYITVRGFTLAQAATPWAPPTAEQIGLIGTHWSRGWLIENNNIHHSICVGVTLGKYGDDWDNTSANTADGYVRTIARALTNGWDKETVGHHIVRNNIIADCGQAGLVGSMGASFSIISGNTVHDIYVRRLFKGQEMAGLKFHGPIDSLIQSNHIYRAHLGLWLDWMAQGTRISGNLFHDNDSEDLYTEVNHGPFVVDNNLLLSTISLLDLAEGGAYAHNLFAGRIVSRPEYGRATPYQRPHSTTPVGMANTGGGDNRFYNNIFVGIIDPATGPVTTMDKDPFWVGGYGLWMYNFREHKMLGGGNVFLGDAHPFGGETNALVLANGDPQVKLVQTKGQFNLQLSLRREVQFAEGTPVTTELLGKTKVTELPFEDWDGSPLKVNTDYFGKKRDSAKPTPGPFEKPGDGALTLRVW
jgi:alpha-N-arabinofuranosidase